MANKHQVLKIHDANPHWTSSEIAAHIPGDCSSEYVRATLYRNGRSLPTSKPRINKVKVLEHYIETLEARIRELEGDEWRPIETAPKDGTWFLAIREGEYAPGEQFLPQCIRWQHDGWEIPDEGQTTVINIIKTHWRPLPDPPRAALEESE